jgi:diguanylate cyclase (GGDEF)-like protein
MKLLPPRLKPKRPSFLSRKASKDTDYVDPVPRSSRFTMPAWIVNRRPSPVVMMAIGLVAICTSLLLSGDLFFGFLDNKEQEVQMIRKRVSENIAANVADALQSGADESLKAALKTAQSVNKDVGSIGIRSADGRLLFSAGDHLAQWKAKGGEQADLLQAEVPLMHRAGKWGSVEVRFRDPVPGPFAWIDRHPTLSFLVFMLVGGAFSIFLYLKRALQSLDPSSVIPERVRMAFDAMTEGVVVIEPRGRIVLANSIFRDFDPSRSNLLTGAILSSVDWLKRALPEGAENHPWNITMAQNIATKGVTLNLSELRKKNPSLPERLVINCAPILDGRKQPRGCMVTFDDETQLFKANEKLTSTLKALEQFQVEIERKNVELERLANHDFLTGCLNRRAFSERAVAMFERSRNERKPMALLMLDIDYFKSVNDRFGHPVGDRVIRGLGTLLLSTSRARDLVGRFGGEEFVVALPDTGYDAAYNIAERIRIAVEEEVTNSMSDIPGCVVTVSVGFATISPAYPNIEFMLNKADEALYTAKQSGRNRVKFADPIKQERPPEKHAPAAKPSITPSPKP